MSDLPVQNEPSPVTQPDPAQAGTGQAGPAPVKAVVVGVDGSRAARAAVEFAVGEAVQRGVALELIHGFTWPWVYPPLVGDVDPADPQPRVRANRSLSETAELIRGKNPGLNVRDRVIDGHAAAVLVDRSREASVLVVGHRGEGGFAELLAGSVAFHTAAHAHCPVIVVRGSVGGPGAPVVVGVDGSAEADKAIEFAFTDAERRGSQLVVVAVWPPRAPARHSLPGPEVLLDSLGRCPDRHPDVEVRTIIMNDPSPAAALIRAGEHAGLIVVGSRGLGGLHGMLLGSVGRALISHAPCPVAIVRGTLS